MDQIWEDIHASREWGRYPGEHIIRFMANNYGKSGKDRSLVKVLDFGCGQGASTWYLSREGYDTYAFDGSESAVIKTRKRLEEEHLHAKVECMNGTELEYPEAFFDAVIDNACVYANRIADIKKMYRMIHAILKEGGKLITVCFGDETDGVKSGEEIEPHSFTGIQEGVLKERGLSHIFSEKELKDLLYEAGFSEVVVDWSKYTVNRVLVHQLICQAVK